MSLRDYQLDLVTRANEGLARLRAEGRRRSVCVQLPTGGGKSRLISALQCDAVIAPGVDLARQLRGSTGCEAYVTNTVLKLARSGQLPPWRRVALDEARWVASAGGTEIVDGLLAAGSELVLFDATPSTPSGGGLGRWAEELYQGPGVAELQQAGYLVPYRILAPAVAQRELAARPVDAWLDHTNGRRAIVFCRDKAHARSTVTEFAADGIPAAFIGDETGEKERRRLLGWTDDAGTFHRGALALGEVWVVVCAQLLRQGIDVPEVAAIIVARAFDSYSLFMQGIGRGSRPCEAIGKADCVVIDLHGSLIEKHGLPTDPKIWSLEGQAVRDPLDPLPPCIECRACLGYSRCNPCEFCGAVKPPPPPPRVRVADLVEIRALETDSKKRETLSRYVRDAVSRGHSPWAAKHKYRAVYGADPPREWLTAEIRDTARLRAPA